MIETIRFPVEFGDIESAVSVSIGVSINPENATDAPV